MATERKSTSTVVKIKPDTHAVLQDISRDEDRPMGEIISDLVERYERERFWKAAAADLARLKQDDRAWQEYQGEAGEFDQLANDGLENEPPFFTPEEEEEIRAEIAAESQGR